ncbi:MAG TPA: acido-empty-quinoprotein group A [Terriglobia bacterium]|nr:acido-empty-quinoprotein group A [Terriglobia bacterium]
MTKSILAFLLCVTSLHAQSLDPAALLKPPTDAWPSHNGDYTGRRFSTLSQINQGNIHSITLDWAFQTHQQAMKSTPLEVNGILYFTVPNHVWAVDARTGRQIWQFQRQSEGNYIGQRGVAMYHDRLYFGTPDAHMICLNARDGKKIWEIEVADVKFGYYISVAPLVIKDKLIVGMSNDQTDIAGFLDARSPEDGKLLWHWDALPKPGAPGSETWPNKEIMAHGGGTTWMPGTYDPELNLIYWGTGNPHPVLAGAVRPGANLYTCSIVALNADTGKMAWYFQASPHDTQDRDANETPVIFDADFHGRPRKLLAQASRNGYFFLLDRATGESLLSAPYGPENWTARLNQRGEPIPKPEKEPRPEGALFEGSGTNWWAPSFDPDTGLFYVNAHHSFLVTYLTRDEKDEASASDHQGGMDSPLWAEDMLVAIDFQTGKIRWQRDRPVGTGQGSLSNGAGILTTAGHLLITGDDSGDLIALDPATGKSLWHLYAGGRLTGCPMTYELDGRQYILTAVDSVLYAWALPENSAHPEN